MSNSNIKVIVGMSGGVDSSVAALLLIEQGYQVEGLFMKNWEEDDDTGYCSAEADHADAEAVCNKLGIPLHQANFARQYWDNVFEHFLHEYQAGRTPNPDILCNREIKFKAFLDYALELGADYIATGHYVKKTEHAQQYQLVQADDDNKDQSYFLYTLGQEQLAKSLFPLANIEKPKVRELAKQHQFINHQKKDSTGICFIGERKFKNFLAQYLPAQPGKIEDLDGHIIGEHSGLMYYTRGQRQGLGIGGQQAYGNEPWYVVGKDLNRNVLLAVQGHNHPSLMNTSLRFEQDTWVSGQKPETSFNCLAKIRYRQASQQCTVTPTADGSYQVVFAEPQRAINPGQSIVLYQDRICLGGGVISHYE